MSDPHGGHSAPAGGAKTSPIRLIALLAILGLLVGALGYDQLVAAPAVVAANKRLEEEANKNNAVGFKGSLSETEKKEQLANSMLDAQDVRRILKKNPTSIDRFDGYAVEYYCWWGYIPVPRQYVSVVYYGTGDNLRYSTHYANQKPPEDSLPGYKPPVVEGDGKDAPPPAGMAGPMMGAPMGPGPGAMMGKGGMGKGGKGKGGKGKRPAAEESGEQTPPADEPAPPSDDSADAEVTSKAAESKTSDKSEESSSEPASKPAESKTSGDAESKSAEPEKSDEPATDPASE